MVTQDAARSVVCKLDQGSTWSRVVATRRSRTASETVIGRFLIHVLPKGQHRIRHYGFFGNGNRAANIARIRELLAVDTPATQSGGEETPQEARILALPCPCCGGRLIIIEAFGPGGAAQHRPVPEAIDSS
jgi:hypothetical protein